MRRSPIVTPRVAIVAFAFLFAVSMALTRLRSRDDLHEPSFTDEQQTILAGVEPILDSLLPEERDLGQVSRSYESCQAGEFTGVNYVIRSGEVKDVNETSIEQYPNAHTSFCQPTGAQIGFQVILPGDRGHLAHIQRSHEILSQGGNHDLDVLIEEKSKTLAGWGRIVEANWLDASGVGDSSFGFVVTTEDAESSDRYHFAWIKFTRGVVMGGLWLQAQTSPEDVGGRAIRAARAFDDRIGDTVDDIVATAD
jgi:hypothetical protein